MCLSHLIWNHERRETGEIMKTSIAPAPSRPSSATIGTGGECGEMGAIVPEKLPWLTTSLEELTALLELNAAECFWDITEGKWDLSRNRLHICKGVNLSRFNMYTL